MNSDEFHDAMRAIANPHHIATTPFGRSVQEQAKLTEQLKAKPLPKSPLPPTTLGAGRTAPIPYRQRTELQRRDWFILIGIEAIGAAVFCSPLAYFVWGIADAITSH